MSDSLDVNPENPDASPAAAAIPVVAEIVKPDFGTSTLHAELHDHIDQFGGYASARLHQLLAEMRDLFNV